MPFGFSLAVLSLFLLMHSPSENKEPKISIANEILPLGNTDSVKTMNGIALSPDQKKLYP